MSDISFLHSVHDRLDVAGAERDVVGHACSRRGVEVDRGGRGAARRFGAERSVFELKVRFNIKILARVVLQRLVDDRGDLMLRQRNELAGVGTFCSSRRLFIRRLLTVTREVGLSFRFRVARSWADYCWDSQPSL